MDCLSYDQYEKVKDRQLKEKQMEKEAKPLPGKNRFKKRVFYKHLAVFRAISEEAYSSDSKTTHKRWIRRRHDCVHSGQMGENASGPTGEMVA